MPVLHRGGKGKSQKVKVNRIKKDKLIGGEGEGLIWTVNVTVERDGKTRTRKMVQKHFYDIPARKSSYRNPAKQFKTMNELIALNREKKLGLKINPTIRLMKNHRRKPYLIMTKLNIREMPTLTEKQRKQYHKSMFKQIKACREHGFRIGQDAFSPIVKNGRATAIITDFGTVNKVVKNRF